MKKFVLVALALFLALPAISFAGSATSKWDVTIGGYVKFDYGWASQSVNADLMLAYPKNLWVLAPGTTDVLLKRRTLQDKYSTLYGAGYETRFNFLIKGPDAWGAKTSAFIEGDFRGGSGFNTGVFTLRHAFMKWNWSETELLLGHTWNAWGGPNGAMIPTVGFMENHILKGNRQPQMRITQWFGKDKEFKAAFAVASPTGFLGETGDGFASDYNNAKNRTNWPHFQGDVEWATKRCGIAGTWPLMIGAGAYYGKDRKAFWNVYDWAWDTEYVKSWAVALRTTIPIIPNKGANKANSLLLFGHAFVGQNISNFYVPIAGVSIYDQRYSNYGYDWTAATSYGGYAGFTYYFTNNFFFNGLYGYVGNNVSRLSSFYGNNAASVKRHQNIIANVMYDVNDAIRLGFEYAWIRTAYAGYGAQAAGNSGAYTAWPAGVIDRKGTLQTFRIGAWYFF